MTRESPGIYGARVDEVRAEAEGGLQGFGGVTCVGNKRNTLHVLLCGRAPEALTRAGQGALHSRVTGQARGLAPPQDPGA